MCDVNTLGLSSYLIHSLPLLRRLSAPEVFLGFRMQVGGWAGDRGEGKGELSREAKLI